MLLSLLSLMMTGCSAESPEAVNPSADTDANGRPLARVTAVETSADTAVSIQTNTTSQPVAADTAQPSPTARQTEQPEQTAAPTATSNSHSTTAVVPTATNTSRPTKTETTIVAETATDHAATATPVSTRQPTRTPAPQTDTPEATAAATATVHPTTSAPDDAPPPTPTPFGENTISGRMLINGEPITKPLQLIVEDQNYTAIAVTTVQSDGTFEITDLPNTTDGYNVLFMQEQNDAYYGTDEVVSYGWIGPIPVSDNATVQLPDFDISLFQFHPVAPPYDTTRSLAQISETSPLAFEWTPYQSETSYWIDLFKGQSATAVWQSDPTTETAVAFDGTTDDGSRLQPGDYWWGVGARRLVDNYQFVSYGYLSALQLEP